MELLQRVRVEVRDPLGGQTSSQAILPALPQECLHNSGTVLVNPPRPREIRNKLLRLVKHEQDIGLDLERSLTPLQKLTGEMNKNLFNRHRVGDRVEGYLVLFLDNLSNAFMFNDSIRQLLYFAP